MLYTLIASSLALAATISPRQTVDLYSTSQLQTMQSELARKASRFASQDLERYPNHYTMLAYRDATGSAEVHEHEADIFFIHDGDAVIVTGGKLIGGHTTKPGEVRGASIDGGEKHALKTGNILHIPAGVPHQLLVTPGKPITYFVVKVTGQ